MFCKIILLQFTDCALPEWQRTELWPLRPKASGPSPPAVPDAAQNKDEEEERSNKMRKSFFFPQLPQKISGLYPVRRFLPSHFLSCWAPLSESTEVSYQPSFIQKVIIMMILGKKGRKDCKCTPHFRSFPACNVSITNLVMWSGYRTKLGRCAQQ